MVTIRTTDSKDKISLRSEIDATPLELTNSIAAIFLFFRDNYPEETLIAFQQMVESLESK